MFTSVNRRSASAYQRVNVETSVSEASPHQLVVLLFDQLLRSLAFAREAMAQGQTAAKCEHISKAVRIIDEGLMPSLNLEEGGDIAANLKGLYGYCVMRLIHANVHNDVAGLNDVLRVMEPIVQGWKQIGGQMTVQ